jgi:5'-nucleotidase
MGKKKAQILLTNDDGIQSPGLWAAASALDELGHVTVVAPREQSSGAGRSLPSTSDGIITQQEIQVNGKTWTVYALGGTPAQAVLYGSLEIMKQKPDLVVSGINYGENVGLGVTVSGTVGAALEGAALGVPSMAISLQTEIQHHLSYSTEVDFSAAAYFTAYFGQRLLERGTHPDFDVLKLDIPAKATPETDWSITRLSTDRFFIPEKPARESWDQPGGLRYHITDDWHNTSKDSDVYALNVKKQVSVTPLSLDLTASVSFENLDALLRE